MHSPWLSEAAAALRRLLSDGLEQLTGVRVENQNLDLQTKPLHARVLPRVQRRTDSIYGKTADEIGCL